MDTVDTVIVGSGPLTFDEVAAVARGRAPVELSGEAEAAISASRNVIDDLAGDTAPHYGVSTGFGALATRHIPPERRAQLQRSLNQDENQQTSVDFDGWTASLRMEFSNVGSMCLQDGMQTTKPTV